MAMAKAITQSRKTLAHLYHFSTWITPGNEVKRFYTQFYFAILPRPHNDYFVTVNPAETASFCWLTPKEALSLYARRKLSLIPPQYAMLHELDTCTTMSLLKQYIHEKQSLSAYQSASLAIEPEIFQATTLIRYRQAKLLPGNEYIFALPRDHLHSSAKQGTSSYHRIYVTPKCLRTSVSSSIFWAMKYIF